MQRIFKTTLVTAAAIAIPAIATAQTVTIYEAPPNPVMKPIERDDAGIIRAQFIRASDVTPEEYQRLLDEAAKVSTYQSYTNTVREPAATLPLYQAPGTAAPLSYGTAVTPYQSPVTPYQSTVADSAFTNTVTSSTHRVVKGDTLYNIAKRNGVTVSALKSVNGIAADAISLGQSLLIPGSTSVTRRVEPTSAYNSFSGVVQASQPAIAAPFATTTRAYAVSPGDTLYSISRRACTTVGALQAANGLAGSAISPGQRLSLPSGHCLN